MKTLRIVAVITLAVVVAAMLIATAYAYTGGRIGTSVSANSVPTGITYRNYGGMMGSSGMMGGYGYCAPFGTGPQQSGAPSTAIPTVPSNLYPIGGWGCAGMRRIFG
jgi:hypothetical protein